MKDHSTSIQVSKCEHNLEYRDEININFLL